MVSIGLNTKSTIPTIRRAYPANQDGTTQYTSTTSGSWVDVGDNTCEIADGETAYLSYNFRSHSSSATYIVYVRWLDTNTGNAVVWSNGNSSSESTHSNSWQTRYITHTNNTGATQIIKMQMYVNHGYTGYSNNYGGFVFNASDKAKWEIISLPSTRFRKYAIDKIYTIVPHNGSSINIEGYSNSVGKGIVSLDVDTISTKLEITGSGTAWFQFTGQGFTVNP